MRPPIWDLFLSISCTFYLKTGCAPPHLRQNSTPPFGKSWIRHCICSWHCLWDNDNLLDILGLINRLWKDMTFWCYALHSKWCLRNDWLSGLFPSAGVPFKMINFCSFFHSVKFFTILVVAEFFYCFPRVTVPNVHCLQTSPIKFDYMRNISETGVLYTTYTWCNILIRPHFPVHIKGIPKWDTHLYMPLECRVHHLACTAQRRGHKGMRQVLTFAHVWWWILCKWKCLYWYC